jgi:hypothetical protein
VSFPKFLKRFVVHAAHGDLMGEDEGRFREWARAERELGDLHSALITQQNETRAHFRRA